MKQTLRDQDKHNDTWWVAGNGIYCCSSLVTACWFLPKSRFGAVSGGGNGISVGGARALGQALKENTTLTELGNNDCENQVNKKTQQESKASQAHGTWSNRVRYWTRMIRTKHIAKA